MKDIVDDASGSKPGRPLAIEFPHVARLLDILGEATPLLHWPRGTKGSKRKWGHLTLDAMKSRAYLRKLEAGNIGVALGMKSDRLIAVDLDRDDLREPFLALNEWARRTTEVKGERGCKFLVRIRDEYPPTTHLHRGKEDAAQWLADGTQAIVSGTHPAGMDYIFVNRASPLEIECGAVVWPEGLTIPRFKRDFTEHRKQQSKRATEHSSSGATEQGEPLSDGEHDAVFALLMHAAVQSAVPKTTHQNNPLLFHLAFHLARSLRDIEAKIGRPASSTEWKMMFELWAKDSRPFWRPEQSSDEYWFEFLDACDRARFGLEENPLAKAWEAAHGSAMPQEAIEAVEDPRLRVLISFCRQMQILSGERPFFIPTRWLGERFGVSHSQAALWLRGLRHTRFLKVEIPGDRNAEPAILLRAFASRPVTSTDSEVISRVDAESAPAPSFARGRRCRDFRIPSCGSRNRPATPPTHRVGGNCPCTVL